VDVHRAQVPRLNVHPSKEEEDIGGVGGGGSGDVSSGGGKQSQRHQQQQHRQQQQQLAPPSYAPSSSSLSLISHPHIFQAVFARLQSAIVTGFQMASAAGPLMHEPMHGLCFCLEKIDVALPVAIASAPHLADELEGHVFGEASSGGGVGGGDGEECGSSASSTSGSVSGSGGGGVVGGLQSGQLISDVIESLRLCMLSLPLRVVEPIYSCNLQCDQSQLGNLYAVLTKRRGEVLKEDIIDGTSLYILTATLPVSESFGFAQELLKRTSGNATAPQLFFSHWQLQDIDPFWRPTTAEERDFHGEVLALEPNAVRACIDKVRKRKGLPIEEKVVASAEKQRTLNKKK